jgi:hypothetical protein
MKELIEDALKVLCGQILLPHATTKLEPFLESFTYSGDGTIEVVAGIRVLRTRNTGGSKLVLLRQYGSQKDGEAPLWRMAALSLSVLGATECYNSIYQLRKDRGDFPALSMYPDLRAIMNKSSNDIRIEARRTQDMNAVQAWCNTLQLDYTMTQKSNGQPRFVMEFNRPYPDFAVTKGNLINHLQTYKHVQSYGIQDFKLIDLTVGNTVHFTDKD